ncbi:hypothetical protein BG015_006941 [Linnemannia schmuckeri]|uniref:C2H2-type domain-containing protein n=1 Tax=Linnemannia schmuckeri TaxID=64567 RepID=A0A9P5RZ72_9FUNG|nr:hypothetical protein BG015_006941 [Linnemannia schmuckeri]
MRTHWRIKPYSCPECHRNFVRQDALTRHLRLDFGHNRCSGYPGPLPGNADQGEKDGDEDEEDMMEDDEDFPDPDAEDQNTGNDSKPTSKSATNTTGSATTAAGVKGDPSPALPSPTSPTAVSNKAKAASTPGASDQERERSLTISTAAANANASAVYTVAASSASATKETHPTLRTSDLTQSKFDKEDQERSPHARHSSSATPMSFVHLADRPVATPEGGKEVSGQPHSRSYSHSAYNYGPTTPLTIQTGNMPMRPTKHLERRATAPVAREGESWLGHAQGQGYAQEPVSSPVDEYPRGGPGYGGYRHDMDRPRSATHLPPDYPTSPKDIRRSPGPQSAQGEWHTRSGPPSAHWGWSNPPPSSQDARLRHPTWSSSSSLPSHSQDPSSMQPPHSPAESWSRGHPPSSPHDDPRKSSIRAMSRYGSSPYPIPDHGSGGAERHHRGSSGPMSPAGPMRSSDPYRRSTATAEMDRVGSWNEQRSRSFHGAEGMQDPRSRYESAGSNLPPASSAMSAGRSPIAADATSSSLVSERSHSVSGMVGVERLYPATSIGGGSFHEREHPSGSIPSPIKSSMAAGDLNGRDYRPTRSQSMMDYDADRMAAAAMRRSRYAGDPKVMLREERRSMSPPGHRLPIIDTSRSYEGGGPRYPYSAGAERPPSGPGPAMEGGSYSSREEMDEMQTRRRDEGGVPNSGGYYDEHGPRSATFQRAPHGY